MDISGHSSSIDAAEGGSMGEEAADEPSRAAAATSRGRLPAATSDTVGDYLRAIARTPLLTAAEERDLAFRIEAGVLAAERLATTPGLTGQEQAELAWLAGDGVHAKRMLTEANLRLVVSIAKRFTGRGVAMMDLVQEGNLGLLRAVEKFDYRQGFKFSTYATWWIRQSVTRALAMHSRTIRVPVHVVEVVNRVRNARRTLHADLGREPAPEEVADRADLTVEELAEVDSLTREPLSLEVLVGADGDTELADLLADTGSPAPDDVVAGHDLHDQLWRLLRRVGERASRVVALRYGLADGRTRTCKEIGELYGVSRERIRQIETQALARLARDETAAPLRTYLSG